MTYIEQAQQLLIIELGEIQPDFGVDLIDLYTLLVLTVGPLCTSAHVHAAWAVSRQRSNPAHPDLVPFHRLTPEAQAHDAKHRDAIRRAAKRINTGGL